MLGTVTNIRFVHKLLAKDVKKSLNKDQENVLLPKIADKKMLANNLSSSVNFC